MSHTAKIIAWGTSHHEGSKHSPASDRFAAVVELDPPIPADEKPYVVIEKARDLLANADAPKRKRADIAPSGTTSTVSMTWEDRAARRPSHRLFELEHRGDAPVDPADTQASFDKSLGALVAAADILFPASEDLTATA